MESSPASARKLLTYKTLATSLAEQVRPNILRPGWHRCLGYRMWRGQHSWCLPSVSKGVCWIDYAMTCQFGQRTGSYSSYLGYSAQQCQTWMNGELTRLSQEVTDMQNAGSLTGRKKAASLAKGIKAQETLNKYAQCNVLWQPIDAAPLTTGGNGYVDGGDVDISGFERVGPSVAQTSDSSAVKLTQGSTY